MVLFTFMNFIKLLRPTLEGFWMAAALTLILTMSSIDALLPAPAYESLESIEGTLTELTLRRNTWKISIQNPSSKRTFYISKDKCHDLSRDISIGDPIDAKLHRKFWGLGDIQGWELSTHRKLLVSYEDHRASDPAKYFGVLGLYLVFLTFILSVYYKLKEEHSTGE